MSSVACVPLPRPLFAPGAPRGPAARPWHSGMIGSGLPRSSHTDAAATVFQAGARPDGACRSRAAMTVPHAPARRAGRSTDPQRLPAARMGMASIVAASLSDRTGRAARNLAPPSLPISTTAKPSAGIA